MTTDPIMSLASSVVLRAVGDAKSKQVAESLEAGLWLASQDVEVWLAAALGGDIDAYRDWGLRLLQSGGRNLPTMIKRVRQT